MNGITIAWYENTDGEGAFGPQHIITGQPSVDTTGIRGSESVYAVDIDGDGDVDVLAGSLLDNRSSWLN